MIEIVEEPRGRVRARLALLRLYIVLRSSPPVRQTRTPSQPAEQRRYRIDELIAKGGMAEVFRATDVKSKRVVALKRLSSKDDVRTRLLFQREYLVLSQIHHPRVIEVYDYGTDDQGPYYAMELLDGDDLRKVAPLEVVTICRLLRDVASSLALLHARRLVHRDVSAGNIRLTADGHCKLLDFGAMTVFGIPDQLVGTPPYVPPEALHCVALDQRADLYGLGALAYFLLTGRHAFPAARIEQLLQCWVEPPRPPSEFRTDVPSTLDELVLSLLSLEMLSRPSTAADVIHRLDAITGESPDEDERVATSYLTTPALIGRERSESIIATLLAGARNGKGGSILIEAAAGGGKSRLLGEAMIAAGVEGLTVARGHAATGSGSYGVVRALALSLLRALGDDATSGAGAYDGILGHLIPELSGASPERQPSKALPDDAGETRARVQKALLEWFTTVSRRHPLLVAVDNVERIDEASCSFLAVLADAAPKRPIAVVATINPASQVAAPPAAAMLRTSSRLISLQPFSAEETAALVRSLFGDGPNVAGLAGLVHHVAFGSPLVCMAAARHLVGSGAIAYERGAWSIPRNITLADLPASLGEVYASIVARLSPAALSIANLLSLARSDLDLEVLAVQEDRQKVFTAIGELVEKEVVSVSGERYRIAQEPLRDFLSNQIAEDSKRALHCPWVVR